MNEFFQEGPKLTNTFHSHRWLKSYLRFKLPKDMQTEVSADLEKLGERCATDYMELAKTAEREKPVLVSFDTWGRRLDKIRVSRAWTDLQDISAREGMFHIGYKRAHGDQFLKLYLFHPSSAFFTCPLAMADGAAKVLETYGTTDRHREAFRHLTSNDPKQFWTSGQWMTEKSGGSDVSGFSTQVRFDGDQARLYGTKWFSSATTSHMSLALARQPGSPDGSRGLTLYFVPMYLGGPDELNHIRFQRLKDKLGTWALPTAELELDGALAYPIGEKDHGVKTVATMLNVTRLYNSVCSVGQMTRALEQMRDYSGRRQVFGAPLTGQPLHFTTFAHDELKMMAGFLLTMELVHLLGKEECKTATAEDTDILRLMTPVCKLFTGRAAIQTASEVVEGFGGVGYIEDSGVPVHLRDSQVFPIWEGATNVLSLDLLRVLQKSGALNSLEVDILRRLQSVKRADLTGHRELALKAVRELGANMKAFANLSPELQQASSRELAFYLGRLYSFALLLAWSESEPKLAPWLDMYAKDFLGIWTPKAQADVQSARQIWSGSIS